MTEQMIQDRYFELLQAHVARPAEEHLAVIAELGRELVLADVPPEEIAEIHEEALQRLAQERPDVTLLDTARLLSAPLMEMLMAYGLAFRERNVQLQREIAGHKRAEEELRKHREHLEELVEERTSALGKKTSELEQANVRLQEADRLKSIFLASMSHELRTPLNSIIGFTSIILMGMVGEISEEQRKQLTMAKNSAHHLLSLINDLLDISRIEAGRVELSLEEFRLDDVTREVVETFSPAVSEKGLELLTEVPEGITLFSDRRRMKQVLMNLVSNAIKFTNQGSVKIAARILDETLEMRVIDTGIGIKREDMNRLFEPFQQVDMSLTKKYEGTGLGLYLCKKLVALLGGEISAKSEYGGGSEFTFALPLKYEEEK